MEYLTPNFTKDMVKTHTILVPNMAVIQFTLIKAVLESEGFHVEIMSDESPEIARLGQKYVHNDTCYPAVLIIGQFLHALESGKYDPEHTALLISQTGGGCRASNYIRLLRKALVKAGYSQIPVASINPAGLEKESCLPLNMRMIRKLLAAVEYGDEIALLTRQVRPYEIEKGNTDQVRDAWLEKASALVREPKNCTIHAMKKYFRLIAEDFAKIPADRNRKRIKTGIVGEIYVKFSPLGNNHLEEFLEDQGCEVCVPGLMGFVEYCAANYGLDVRLYGGRKIIEHGADMILNLFDSIASSMNQALQESGFHAPVLFRELMRKPEGILHLGTKMGEGWLLTAEMVELIESGFVNIVCAQPFGCLPNHIAGKGVAGRIRELYPEANITAVDYDPGAAKVNQENRIKLMLAVAAEKL